LSESNGNASRGGIGFFGLLAIVFIVLKLTGQIRWSWVWVTAPLWGPVALVVLGVRGLRDGEPDLGGAPQPEGAVSARMYCQECLGFHEPCHPCAQIELKWEASRRAGDPDTSLRDLLAVTRSLGDDALLEFLEQWIEAKYGAKE
jgi:hypothetical protein